jgi:hypothetical protein
MGSLCEKNERTPADEEGELMERAELLQSELRFLRGSRDMHTHAYPDEPYLQQGRLEIVAHELECTMGAVKCIQDALAKMASDHLKILVATSLRHTLDETRAFLEEHSVTRASSSANISTQCLATATATARPRGGAHTPTPPLRGANRTEENEVEVYEVGV